MKIIRENGKIKVECDYNKKFIAKAHELNGRWVKPYWVFSEATASTLDKALIDVYGEGFEPVARVAVEIDLDNFCTVGNPHEISLGGGAIARRISRDGRVILADDAFVKCGGFKPSGGSSRYPEVTWEEGTIIAAKVPETLAYGPGVTVVSNADDHRDALEAEQAQLLARLAEIETALASL